MEIRTPVAGCVLLFGLLSASGLLAQTPLPMPPRDPQAPTPAKAPGTIPSNRPIFVPLWTDATGKEAPATARRVRADFVWTDVGVASGPKNPTLKPEKGSATLLGLRPRVTGSAPQRRDFVATVRVQSDRPVARPFLELVDSASLLQSRAWGRLQRRTADGAEWVFVLPDPVPPPPARPNPVSSQVKATTAPPRNFELRLVSDAAS
jgi:hypothetical protein